MTKDLVDFRPDRSLISKTLLSLAEDFLRSQSDRTREDYRAAIEDFWRSIVADHGKKAS